MLAIVALGALVAVVAACGGGGGSGTQASGSGSGSGDKVTKVRLGYFPNITHGVPLVAVNKGLFAKELGDVKVESRLFTAGPEAIEATFSGALDMTYIGPNPSINAFQKSSGEAVRVVAGAANGGAALVVKPDINSAQDLRGKSVATPELGNTQDVALRNWLKENGLSADTAGGGDVHVQPQDPATALTRFQLGELQAAWVPEPWVAWLVSVGGKVLIDERTVWPDGKFVTANLLVNREFLDAHPDVVTKVLAGHLAAIDLIRSDPTGAREAAKAQLNSITATDLPAGVVDAAWENVEFTADPLPTAIQKAAVDAKDVGLLKSEDITGLFDLRLLNELLTARGQPTISVEGGP